MGESNRAAVGIERFKGQLAVRLSSGAYEAVFLPELGMLGASLTFGGEQYLSLHGGLAAYRHGHTTGMPLLHPWANRLDGSGYKIAGREVSLRGNRSLSRDDHRLPIHGTMGAASGWELTQLAAGRRTAVLTARFDFGARDDLLRTFPFPHIIEIEARLRADGLAVATTVTPTTKQQVPISFGWHPYFTLPGVRRADMNVLLPRRRHVLLDSRMLPTGEEVKEKAEAEPLGRRTFDDAYRLGRDRTLGLGGGGKGLTLECDANYRYAQVFAPAGKTFVALEPMTAPINALATKDCPRVKLGSAFTAAFTVRIAVEGPNRETGIAAAGDPASSRGSDPGTSGGSERDRD